MCLNLLEGIISREADFKELYYININFNINVHKLNLCALIISSIYNLLSNHINLSQSLLPPWLTNMPFLPKMIHLIFFYFTYAYKIQLRLYLIQAAFLSTSPDSLHPFFAFLRLDVSFYRSVLGMIAVKHLDIW